MRSKLLLAIVSIAGAAAAIKKLSERYQFGFYYMDKLDNLEDSYESMDLRGVPTHQCVCGSTMFNVRATFYNFEIASYMLDMECVKCGSLATAPTPLDMETME